MIGRGMMQRLVDTVLGIAKESIKTISQESFNTTVRLINGFSALVLAVLPAKSSLEGIQGWELRPTLRGPRLPQWMEEGVSSFNSFIHDYDSDIESETESEYESGLDDESLPPSSPCSQTSYLSRISSGGRNQQRHSSIWKRTIRKLLWPVRIWSSGGQPPSTPRGSSKGSHGSSHERSGSSGSFNRMYSIASRHLSGVKDYMTPKQTGDRRRGIVEDLQLSMELFIERMFEVVRNFIYYLLSPLETFKLIFIWVLFSDPYQDSGEEVVDTATLGDSGASPQKQLKQGQSLNTDGRTCEDVITSLGYPYEALRVTTADGHILLLERIPRRNSQKVLYLQHGLMDSSLGWVSSGVVGSQAFAAYDQGYDVFLGNFRGLASKEHVNKYISAQRYWQYSVNEHGTQDIPAILTEIHEIKMFDLKDIRDEVSSSNPVNCQGERLPYSLCGVAHSLGGASILMYVVTQRLENKPHYLSRLILLSPAGFHEDAPAFCAFLQYVIPIIAPVIRPLVPGLYIPTRFFRGLFNKLARDFQKYPAVGGLVQTLLSYMVGGDSSNWVGAIGMSHYNMNDMPGVSFQVAQHLAQMMRARRFRMFDFGSARANLEAYGTREPLDIGAYYGVIDIPVDVVAGLKDRLIPRSMVRRHYQTLKEAGCKASYDEFEYAHLDFTFSHKEELLAYVMSRLLLVTSPRLQNGDLRSFKSRSVKKVNAPPSKKSFKKPKILIDGGIEDKEVISELLQNGQKTGSRKAQKSRQVVAETELMDDTPPYTLTSTPTPQSEVENIHNHDQGILRTVSAGSIATPSHEESGREPHMIKPDSFDESSLFAFPSREVVSIISKRASTGGKRGVDATRISESDINRGFEIRSPADRSRSSERLSSSTTKDASRISAFSKLRKKFFGSSSSRSDQLCNYQRSHTQ